MLYRVLLKGKPVILRARFLRFSHTETSILDYAYIMAARTGGTVIDETGQYAPAIRHQAKIELYDYFPENGGAR